MHINIFFHFKLRVITYLKLKLTVFGPVHPRLVCMELAPFPPQQAAKVYLIKVFLVTIKSVPNNNITTYKIKINQHFYQNYLCIYDYSSAQSESMYFFR